MKPELKAIGSFGTVGLEIALSILLGSYAGYWADGKFGTSPALVIVGFAFGCAAAVKVVLRAYREMQAVAKQEEREQGNPAPLFDRVSDGSASRSVDRVSDGSASRSVEKPEALKSHDEPAEKEAPDGHAQER